MKHLNRQAFNSLDWPKTKFLISLFFVQTVSKKKPQYIVMSISDMILYRTYRGFFLGPYH